MNPHLDAILEAASYARHVTINRDRLEACAENWRDAEFSIPAWREPIFPQDDDETIINFLGVGSAINFFFGAQSEKFAIEYLGTQWNGAFGMWASLKRALDEGIPVLDAKYLSTLSEREVAHIFRGNPPMPMLAERRRCLRSAGIALLKLGGSYAELFRRTHFRAYGRMGRGIIDLLTFYDAAYRDSMFCRPAGRMISFHTRANRFVMMYHGRALASDGKLQPIRDAASLTPPADPEIARGLRHLRILEYDSELSSLVDARVPIPRRSVFELEIRMQTVAAMQCLCAMLSRLRDERVPIAALDEKVRAMGRKRPSHCTETTAY